MKDIENISVAFSLISSICTFIQVDHQYLLPLYFHLPIGRDKMWLSFAYCWYITMCAVIVSADENDSCRYTSLNGPVDGEARYDHL